jgi:hypothetical protein
MNRLRIKFSGTKNWMFRIDSPSGFKVFFPSFDSGSDSCFLIDVFKFDSKYLKNKEK